ncbi:hypothetical protein [Streptacidiphilus sp. EB129]|uniref:hypothetical protein n=1 Tax=Streptacidiphilus sp. EB129 TaxID=3156262 RepID=UPI003512B1F4
MTIRPTASRRVLAAASVSLLASGAVFGAASAALAATGAQSAVTVPSGFAVRQLATAPAGQSSPDDITRLGDHLFVTYQNGIGPDGKPGPSGATKSTVVEYTMTGQQVASWSITGKVDGLGADADGNRVFASVNEDANSSLYVITPGAAGAAQLTHYAYQGLTHGGGTDSILVDGTTVYVTASNPAADADGKTYSKPALYTAKLTAGAHGKDGSATLTPVLADNASATDVVTGKKTTLNLSDPDSSELVPSSVPGLGGTLLLDSQGDKQLVFLKHGADPKVLNLTTQVDDTAFATNTTGTLYVVDSSTNRLLAVTGHFTVGEAFTAVPNDSDTLPGTLGRLDLATGKVSAFAAMGSPKGLLFVDDPLPAAGSPSTAPSAASSATGSGSTPASASASGPALAETGGGSGTGTMAGLAAGVIVLGAGAVVVSRRRSAARHS